MTETVALQSGETIRLHAWKLEESVHHTRLFNAVILRLTAPLRGGSEDPQIERTLQEVREVIVLSLEDPQDATCIHVADLAALLDALARLNGVAGLLGTAMNLHLQFTAARAQAADGL
ncbi:hypothetical protein [Deinococcus sp.]|uniref:hypothetical protein n=1 Tax=Deinococcus sp. TaxID=47478 RepID=UPI002869D8FE|nr:hypothetical protein [Deinococcus sp.]